MNNSSFVIQPQKVSNVAGALEDISHNLQTLPGVIIRSDDLRTCVIQRAVSTFEDLFTVTTWRFRTSTRSRRIGRSPFDQLKLLQRLRCEHRTHMADHNSRDIIQRYLQDAIAAENTFESQLRGMAKEGDDPTEHALFQQHAEETRSQIDRLTARLAALGESPSTMKSFMAHMFAFAPKTAQIGHDEAERVTQNLMMAYAVEHSEIAMYESLATVAAAAGDQITASLAREIQTEEMRTAEKIWAMIPSAATTSLSKLVGEMTR